MLFSAVALSIAAATTVSALTITAPDSNGWNNSTVTVTWTTASGDPDVFSMELRDTNTPSVITNNVNSSAGTYSFELPPVPAATTYQLEFVNVTNINQVYATSVTFPIANSAQAATSSASASAAASNTITSTHSSTSASATSTAPASTTSRAANTAAGLHIPAAAALFLAGIAALL